MQQWAQSKFLILQNQPLGSSHSVGELFNRTTGADKWWPQQGGMELAASVQDNKDDMVASGAYSVPSKQRPKKCVACGKDTPRTSTRHALLRTLLRRHRGPGVAVLGLMVESARTRLFQALGRRNTLSYIRDASGEANCKFQLRLAVAQVELRDELVVGACYASTRLAGTSEC